MALSWEETGPVCRGEASIEDRISVSALRELAEEDMLRASDAGAFNEEMGAED